MLCLFCFLKQIHFPLSGRGSPFPFPPSCRRRSAAAAGGSGQRREGIAVPRPPRDRTAAMETLYRLPFAVLECPNIKLKRPSWVHMPSAMTVYALVVVSYFLITGGEARAGGMKGTPRSRSSSPSVPAPSGRARADPVAGSEPPVKPEPRASPSVRAVQSRCLLSSPQESSMT